MDLTAMRCPWCGDLFMPEDGVMPTHYLDSDEVDRCGGSGLDVAYALPKED
jgi:hypothetical protein